MAVFTAPDCPLTAVAAATWPVVFTLTAGGEDTEAAAGCDTELRLPAAATAPEALTWFTAAWVAGRGAAWAAPATGVDTAVFTAPDCPLTAVAAATWPVVFTLTAGGEDTEAAAGCDTGCDTELRLPAAATAPEALTWFTAAWVAGSCAAWAAPSLSSHRITVRAPISTAARRGRTSLAGAPTRIPPTEHGVRLSLRTAQVLLLAAARQPNRVKRSGAPLNCV